MRELTCEPGTEVSDAAMLSLIECLTAAEIAPLVKKYGYEDIQADKWYSAQGYLDFLTGRQIRRY